MNQQNHYPHLALIQSNKIIHSNGSHSHQQKCDLLLQEPEIRFAGIINERGHLVAGGMKKGVEFLEREKDSEMLYMELALRVKMRTEFDSDFGQTKYSASRREKATVFSFPLDNVILFVSAESNVDIDKTAKKVTEIYRGINSDNFLEAAKLGTKRKLFHYHFRYNLPSP